jgi:MoaA/NifB/PqqE/SkfB family radical SAM enzyme
MIIDSKKIALYLTNKCNLKCKHCFIEGSPLNESFLNWKQIKTALNYFYSQGFKHVEITGGESCLSPFFLPAIKEAKKIGYTVGVSTNGTNGHIFEIITPKFVDKITFSLDGATAKTHDRLRGPGVYKLCLQNIKKTITKGYRVEVVYTVHRYNLKEIGPIIKLLDRLKVNRLTFGFINNAGSATLNQHFLVEPKHWISAKKTIEANSKTNFLSLRYPPLFVTKSEFQQIKDNSNYHCFVSEPVKIEIYPDGYFYGCCFTTQNKDLALGRIFNDHVEADNTNAKNFSEKYRHLSCPALQTSLIFSNNHNLIPVCLYCKIITEAKTFN